MSGRSSRHAGKNPPSGVLIEYYLAQAATSEVMLTFMEAGGEIIQQFSSRSKEGPRPSTGAGTSRFVWDMRYPDAELAPVAGALSGIPGVDRWGTSPPVAPPGRYTVRLTVNGLTHEQPFEIRKDPRLKVSDADLRAQFELMVDIRDRISEVADAVMKIRAVRARLDDRHAELPEDSRVKADRIREQLREIEGILTRWMGTPDHPMMWDAPGLSDKLSRLSLVVGGSAKPTESMYALFEDLSERFEVQRSRLSQVIEQEVVPLLSR